MDTFQWQGDEYDIVVPADDDEPYLALYWEYSCPRAHPYRWVADAKSMLKSDEANGELVPAGVVNRVTGETVWEDD